MALFSARAAKALNGTAFAYAPKPVLDVAVGAVGALMVEDIVPASQRAEAAGDTFWRVDGNALYIGDHAEGSALLVQANRVTKKDGTFDRDRFFSYKVRFGVTVSSKQLDRLVPREEDQFIEGTRVLIHPKHSPATGDYGLALILLPYPLSRDRKPLALVESEEPIAWKSNYLVFGHGTEEEQTERPTVELGVYEQHLTSGYLRWTPMQLMSGYPKSAMFALEPLAEDRLKRLYQEIPEASDAFVNGPCKNDSAAPALIWGNRISKASGLAEPRVALLGMMSGENGLCVRPQKNGAPVAAFIDLREASIQAWLKGNVESLR